MSQDITKELLKKFKPIVVCDYNFNIALIKTQLKLIHIEPKEYKVIKQGAIGTHYPLWLELQVNVEEIYSKGKLPLVILSEVDISNETGGELLTKLVTEYEEGGVVVDANVMPFYTRTISNSWEELKSKDKGRWQFAILDNTTELVDKCLEHVSRLQEDSENSRLS